MLRGGGKGHTVCKKSQRAKLAQGQRVRGEALGDSAELGRSQSLWSVSDAQRPPSIPEPHAAQGVVGIWLQSEGRKGEGEHLGFFLLSELCREAD